MFAISATREFTTSDCSTCESDTGKPGNRNSNTRGLNTRDQGAINESDERLRLAIGDVGGRTVLFLRTGDSGVGCHLPGPLVASGFGAEEKGHVVMEVGDE